MSRQNLLLIGIFLLGLDCFAQQDIRNDSLKCQVVEVKLKTTDEIVSKASELIIYAGEKIVWTQPEASRTYTFLIKSITGSWEDVTTEGSLKYDVYLGDSSGDIIFQRNDSGITIDFQLKNGDRTTFPFTLYIDSIQPN